MHWEQIGLGHNEPIPKNFRWLVLTVFDHTLDVRIGLVRLQGKIEEIPLISCFGKIHMRSDVAPTAHLPALRQIRSSGNICQGGDIVHGAYHCYSDIYRGKVPPAWRSGSKT